MSVQIESYSNLILLHTCTIVVKLDLGPGTRSPESDIWRAQIVKCYVLNKLINRTH